MIWLLCLSVRHFLCSVHYFQHAFRIIIIIVMPPWIYTAISCALDFVNKWSSTRFITLQICLFVLNMVLIFTPFFELLFWLNAKRCFFYLVDLTLCGFWFMSLHFEWKQRWKYALGLNSSASIKKSLFLGRLIDPKHTLPVKIHVLLLMSTINWSVP